MGVSVHYWAIPPQSRLYTRLQVDPAFNALMANLFRHGCGIYHFFEIEAEEVEEILDDVIQRFSESLGPEPEARRRVAEFRAELERTRVEFPGIERRTYMVEKCSSDIEQRLEQALRCGRPNEAKLTSKILYGDKLLAPNLRKPREAVLGLVSLPVVHEGARTLDRLKPRDLFPACDSWERWCRNNYTRWRKVFFEAAKRDGCLARSRNPLNECQTERIA